MLSTSFESGKKEETPFGEELEQVKPRKMASLGELYHYLDGCWYLFIVVGLISAFNCGVATALSVLVVKTIITNAVNFTSYSTLARK
jgi:membrane protein insertase Oxa1/YidC/SpoIIIJ